MKTALTALAAGMAFALAAQDYRAEFGKLAAKGAEQSRAYWLGDHFGDLPWTDADKVLKGRSSHDFAMIYWNFMDARLNGNQESLERALKEYETMTRRFWRRDKRLYHTDYDFLMNTSIALALALSLRDAGAVIPPEVREDFHKKLAGIAVYLPTYTTALVNDDDLRANNQDAFAVFTLALISEELKAPEIRQEALKKFRQVLAKVQQSFWIEGGVDVGYQSVGEPAFAGAADILWDDLSRDEKKQLAELAMNNPVGNGFGIENARSTSWIKPEGTTFSSGLLNRVPNGLVAAEAAGQLTRVAEKGLPTRWWLHDPASLSFFSGVYKNADALAAIPPRPEHFSVGSLACQIMRRDENRDWHTGMEKGYLTGYGNGATAIFGDYSRLNPVQVKSKFGAEHLPFTPNPGGLRYLGYRSHLYLIPDGQLGAPRLNSADSSRYPQLVHRTLYSGAAASEYQLTQVMPGKGRTAPVTVKQTFATVGSVLVAAFQSPDFLRGLSYDFTLPLKRMESGKGSITVIQPPLAGGPERKLSIAGSGVAFSLDKERWEPFFKAELAVGSAKVKLPLLRRIQAEFTASQLAALVFAPEGEASDVKFAEKDGVMRISWKTKDRNVTVGYAPASVDRMVLSVGGTECVIRAPEPGFFQVAETDSRKQLTGFTVYGREFSCGGKPVFTAAGGEAALVSALRQGKTIIADIAEPADFTDFFGGNARSWVDGRTLPLPGRLEKDRVVLY